MTELEWFGRTYRSPVPLPSGYWLAPLLALVILVGSIVQPPRKITTGPGDRAPAQNLGAGDRDGDRENPRVRNRLEENGGEPRDPDAPRPNSVRPDATSPAP